MSTTTVADKPKPATGKANIKIDAELHRIARTIAAWNDMDLFEYVESILRPAVSADLERIQKEIGKNPRPPKA